MRFLVTQPALQAIDRYLVKRRKGRLLRVWIKPNKDGTQIQPALEYAEAWERNVELLFSYDQVDIIITHADAPRFDGCILHWRENAREQGLKFYNLRKIQ